MSAEDLMMINWVLDFRETQDRPLWFKRDELRGGNKDFLLHAGLLKVDSHPIPRGGVFKKDDMAQRLCRKIVNRLREGDRILLICQDGKTTSGYIALACRVWFMDWKTCNVKVACNWCRDEGDFTTARSKEQRAQMDAIFKYTREIESCPFIIKKTSVV